MSMKPTWPERLLAGILLVILGGIVLHAPFIVVFGNLLPEYELLIKAWKEILMLVAGGLAVVVATRYKLWRQLLHDKLIWLCLGFLVVHLVTMLIFWHGAAATLAGLAIDLRFAAYFGLVYILVLANPDWRRRFMGVAAAGAVVVIGFGFLQLFLPPDILGHIGYDKDTSISPYLTVDQNPDYIRINSTLRGPNPLGAYAVIVLAAIAASILLGRFDQDRRRTWLISAGLMATATTVLWVSYSRSALVAGAVAVGLVVLLSYGWRLKRWLWLGLVGLSIIVGGGLYIARESSFVSHVLLHDDPALVSSINSNQGHISSLLNGSKRLVDQPLGAGIGSTGSASLLTDKPMIIENQYLFVAHEIGWLGLGLFMALFGLIMWRLWRSRDDWMSVALLASGVGLALIGLLLPVWVDDTVAIIWWGLAAAILGYNASPRKPEFDI